MRNRAKIFSKNLPNFDIVGGWGSTGRKIFRFLQQKARPCANPRHLSHFASKSVEGSDLQVGWGKTQKVTETPIGKTCRH